MRSRERKRTANVRTERGGKKEETFRPLVDTGVAHRPPEILYIIISRPRLPVPL